MKQSKWTSTFLLILWAISANFCVFSAAFAVPLKAEPSADHSCCPSGKDTSHEEKKGNCDGTLCAQAVLENSQNLVAAPHYDFHDVILPVFNQKGVRNESFNLAGRISTSLSPPVNKTFLTSLANCPNAPPSLLFYR